jgi:hypothetical protein
MVRAALLRKQPLIDADNTDRKKQEQSLAADQRG